MKDNIASDSKITHQLLKKYNQTQPDDQKVRKLAQKSSKHVWHNVFDVKYNLGSPSR